MQGAHSPLQPQDWGLKYLILIPSLAPSPYNPLGGCGAAWQRETEVKECAKDGTECQ